VWGNSLVRHLGKNLRWPRIDPGLPKRRKGDWERHTCRGYLSKGGHVNILNRVQEALSTILTDLFSPIFFSVLRRMLGCNTQRCGTVPTPLSTAATPKCLIFGTNLTLVVTNLSSHPRKPSSQIYAPPPPPHKGLWPFEQWSSLSSRRGLRLRRETR
jgi:hypothetical protein